jgi:hypothetical protein
VLEAQRTRDVALVRLATHEALIALTAAAFHIDIRDRERWTRILGTLAAAAETIPVFRLRYPRQLSRLSQTADVVGQRLASEVATCLSAPERTATIPS